LSRSLTLAAVLIATVVAVSADDHVDQDVISRIKVEGFQHSSVMDTLGYLTDVYGPRLTGSPNLKAAGTWARDQLTKWGLEKAALETYGDVGRGWSLQRFSVEMLEPQYMNIIAFPRAWSPGTNGPFSGTPVLVDINSKEDFDKYRGKLKGAIVMNGRPSLRDQGFKPEASRLSDDELKHEAQQTDPAPAGFPDAPKSYWDEASGWKDAEDTDKAIAEFFRSEGIAMLLEPGVDSQAVLRVDGFYEEQGHSTFPGFVIAREHYGRIVRLLDRKIPVKLEINLATRFHEDDTQGFNVVAEIPGSDPVLKDELVMLGGHLDSWHSGTGATDNAAGSAVVMEAVRIIKALGLKPRRTIRMALWTGEEQGYYGSKGYVQNHFGDLKTMALKPEHAKLAGYFNLDNGSGKIRGVNLQGNEAVRPIFEEYLKPFNYLGATTLTTLNTGGTDHLLFDAVGLPGFQFIQDPLAYDSRTHHTNLDVYESVVEDDLKQASVIMASFVYHTAMRDQKLPRKPLPTPRAADTSTASRP
jgi:carboxypeptidase Q